MAIAMSASPTRGRRSGADDHGDEMALGLQVPHDIELALGKRVGDVLVMPSPSATAAAVDSASAVSMTTRLTPTGAQPVRPGRFAFLVHLTTRTNADGPMQPRDLHEFSTGDVVRGSWSTNLGISQQPMPPGANRTPAEVTPMSPSPAERPGQQRSPAVRGGHIRALQGPDPNYLTDRHGLPLRGTPTRRPTAWGSLACRPPPPSRCSLAWAWSLAADRRDEAP